MFTDMVGYTALGQRNESLSLALVEEQRKLIRPILSRYHGREVKTMGDAFLVEFPNALDAVRCAYDIQRSTKEFNVPIPSERRIHLRIGVHLGDIIESIGDISGDAVNVASRIEPLAEDGGVCVTRSVYESMHNKFEMPLVSIGMKSLKNVNEPIEVYRMEMPWEKESVESGQELEAKRVAVLPFSSMSPDPNDEYFADGMTEELISTIARIKSLTVISRTSAMKYKGVRASVGEISHALRVGSVIEGSVRKSGDRTRIAAQLIDASTDGHLWAQTYEERIDDVFAIQRDIAEKVAEALKVMLLPSERKDMESKPTASPEAFSLYLRGRSYWNERTRERLEKAVRYLEDAVRLDKEFALAYSALADCYSIMSEWGGVSPVKTKPKAKEYAMKALDLNPRLGEAHISLAMVLASYDHDWVKAKEEFRLGLELKPSYATGFQWHSIFLRWMGKYQESFEQISHASSLDPLSRAIGNNVGLGLSLIGKHEAAIEQLLKVIDANPDWGHPHSALGGVYMRAKRFDEAIAETRKALVLSENQPRYQAILAARLARQGAKEEASQIVEALEGTSRNAYVDKVDMATALFAVGRLDEAFSYIEKAYEEKSERLLYYRELPWFEEARNDPRWAIIEQRLAIPGASGLRT